MINFKKGGRILAKRVKKLSKIMNRKENLNNPDILYQSFLDLPEQILLEINKIKDFNEKIVNKEKIILEDGTELDFDDEGVTEECNKLIEDASASMLIYNVLLHSLD